MFFMVLLYTNYLSTEEYGIIDVISTLVILAIPIFTLSISEGIIRFALDKTKNKKQILTISLRILLKGFIALTLISIISVFIGIPIKYAIIFLIYYLTLATAQILSVYLKGLEKIKEIGISTIIRVIVLIILNCLFLVILRLGVIGYYISYICSELIVVLYQIIIIKRTKIDEDTPIDLELSKNMISYSKHFIVSTIGWWINSALDKYLLIFFHGMSINGIYSIAYKIPNILEIAQNIFAQTWQISAIKEFDSEDNKNFFSNMFKVYNIALIFLVFIILFILKLLAKILFANDFYVAWKYVPLLLLAALFGALSGFFNSIFSANKDSKTCSRITITGATINVILNLVLIPKYSANGAAIATFISYFSIFIMNIILSKKYISFSIQPIKSFGSYLLLLIFSISIINIENIFIYLIGIIILVILLIINIKDIKTILQKIFTIIKRRTT